MRVGEREREREREREERERESKEFLVLAPHVSDSQLFSQ